MASHPQGHNQSESAFPGCCRHPRIRVDEVAGAASQRGHDEGKQRERGGDATCPPCGRIHHGGEPGAVAARPAGGPFAPLPLHVESPADNPSTPDKIALGRLLFWDPILSGGQDIACATCHHPAFGYADGRDLPIGTGGKGMGPARTFPGGAAPLVKRNSQTILNVAFNGIDDSATSNPAQAPMFWDSRARGLEAQALIPIESLEEMRGGHGGRRRRRRGRARARARVRALSRAVPAGIRRADAVTALNLSRAIAAYERSLVTTDTPFDRYMRGDHTAMNAVGDPRHGRVREPRLHAVPQRADVLRLQAARHRRLRQLQARRLRSRRGASLRVPDAEPAQPRLHRAVHAQRPDRGPRQRRRLLQDGRRRRRRC